MGDDFMGDDFMGDDFTSDDCVSDIELTAILYGEPAGNDSLRGNSFKHMSEKVKTSELCLIAVQKNESSLKYVPENKKTMEICHAAVK